MNGYDIINPLEIRYDGTERPFIELIRSNTSDVNLSPYIRMGDSAANRWEINSLHDAAGRLLEMKFFTTASGGGSQAGQGDFVFLPDLVEKFRIKADGTIQVVGEMDFANGTTYKIEADGDAVFKNLQLVNNGVIGTGAGYVRIAPTTYVHLQSAAGLSMYFDCGSAFLFRDQDAGDAERFRIESGTGSATAQSFVNAIGGFKDNGVAGVDGTFVDANAKTVTVSGGIITNLDT